MPAVRLIAGFVAFAWHRFALKKNGDFPASHVSFQGVKHSDARNIHEPFNSCIFSGQIIATSHEFSPQKVAFWKGNPRILR